MKSQRRSRFVIAFCVLGALGALSAVMKKPTNFAATAEEHPEAELRPRQYRASVSRTIEALQNFVPTLRTYGRQWRLRSTEKSQADGSVSIHCEVPVLIFTDDLVVKITAHQSDEERVLINIESRSRVGRGDFGENRRHILQLLRVMDRHFAQ